MCKLSELHSEYVLHHDGCSILLLMYLFLELRKHSENNYGTASEFAWFWTRQSQEYLQCFQQAHPK